MKWIFALSQGAKTWPTIDLYEIMALVAVTSAKIYAPSLDPHLIYNGSKNPFTDEMENLGVKVHFHGLSFENAVSGAKGRSESWKQVARGTMLRLDIPSIFESSDETCLYTDVDVIFLDDPGKYRLETKLVAFSTEFEYDNFDVINAGVMLINLLEAKKEFPGLLRWTVDNLEWVPDYDQGALRYYFSRRWDRLDQRLNWKPYWGIGKSPIIVHFHGPKPLDFESSTLLPKFTHPVYARLYGQSHEGYQSYLARWLGYAYQFFSGRNAF
jgi:lipopolysaccharide biosynthesis glycosyltransferase